MGKDLANTSLKEAWLGSTDLQAMRDKINSNACENRCKYEKHCKGGCPIFSEINICNNSIQTFKPSKRVVF